MIEILEKFYNIKNVQYKEYNNGIVFTIDGINYYLVNTFYNEEKINDIYKLSLFLRLRNIRVHEFVFNNKNLLLSDGCVLFKVNVLIDDIDLKDISLFNIMVNEYKNEYISFNKFWEDKIDYLELQLSELSSNKLINNSFDYFAGISELLLSFCRDNYIYDKNVYLIHRIFNSLNSLEFYNPLNVTVGCKYKDIVSYIKITDNFDILDRLLNEIDNNDKIYVFSRMCFPFKYFETVNDVLLSNIDEQVLIDIVDNVEQYEEFLRNMELLFGINLFSWIKKE